MSSTTGKPDPQHLPPLVQERQRLATYGSSVLSDRELLSLLIGAATRSNVHLLVDRLLDRFGTVNAIARAHPADLTVVAGLGPATAARVAAAFELARRSTAQQSPGTITSAQDVAAAVGPLLHGRTRERLVVVVCNRANRILGHEVLSDGSASRALMPIRETLAAVLRRDGQRFALAHNHPSGDPTPSRDDIDATIRVMQAANATELELLEHVVVTDTRWQSVIPPT